MSLVTLSEAQARSGASVTQDMIDEVEETLTHLIGPLVGSRTETYYLSRARDPRWAIDGLYTRRYTSAVILTSTNTGESPVSLTAGTDYLLLNDHVIERLPTGAAWGDTLAAVYEPNDEERVRSVIFDWLIYRQTPIGLQSIRIGAYSETFYPTSGSNQGSRTSTTTSDPVTADFLRRILPSAGLGAYAEPFRYAHTRRDRTLIVGSGS